MLGKLITILICQFILSVHLSEHNVSNSSVHLPKFSLKKVDLNNTTKQHQISSLSLPMNSSNIVNTSQINDPDPLETTKKTIISSMISRVNVQLNETQSANKTNMFNSNQTHQVEKSFIKSRPESSRRMKFFKLNTVDGLLNFYINSNFRQERNKTLNEYNFQFKIVSIQTQNDSETILRLDYLHKMVRSFAFYQHFDNFIS